MEFVAPSDSSPACRSCGRPIIWARLMTRKWVPLDVEPNRSGQIVLLREGVRGFAVEGGKRYDGEVQERRHFNHHTTCGLRGSGRTVLGSLSDLSRGAEDPVKERIRKLQLASDRRRDLRTW